MLSWVGFVDFELRLIILR